MYFTATCQHVSQKKHTGVQNINIYLKLLISVPYPHELTPMNRGLVLVFYTGPGSRRSGRPAPRRSAAGRGCSTGWRPACLAGPPASRTHRTGMGWTGSRAPPGCSTRAVCRGSSCIITEYQHSWIIKKTSCLLPGSCV